MLFIQKIRNIYEGLLLRMLFLLVACSSNDSSVQKGGNPSSERKSANGNSLISGQAISRRDSLLANSNQMLITLDSLQNTGVSSTDSLRANIEDYKEQVSGWYESDLSEDIKMCVDVKRIFLVNDDLRNRHMENYLELISRINSKLSQAEKDSLRQKYHLRLSRDVLHFLQPLNRKLSSMNSFVATKNDIFCPEVYSKEKEKQLKGKAGKENEMQAVLAQFQANPIVQTYTFYKHQQKKLKDDLIGLNRRYHLFF